MKKLLTITVLFACLLARSLFASDIRIVGSVHVNLDPIHQWDERHARDRHSDGKTNSADERPMKHWRNIEITSLIGGGPWPICVVSIDGSKGKEVYLKNLPVTIVNIFSEDARLLSALSNKGQWIASETKRLRAVGAHSSEWEYGSPNYIRYQQDEAYLENQQDALKELHEQWRSNYEQLKSAKKDLAMFTGQVYANREVWDLGQKMQ